MYVYSTVIARLWNTAYNILGYVAMLYSVLSGVVIPWTTSKALVPSTRSTHQCNIWGKYVDMTKLYDRPLECKSSIVWYINVSAHVVRARDDRRRILFKQCRSPGTKSSERHIVLCIRRCLYNSYNSYITVI